MANVCETCGDEGWVEALVFCDSCKVAAVHRYCCGITPVPIDGYVTWFCSDCDESDSTSDSTQVELEDNSNLEVSSSPPLPMEETGTTSDIPGSTKSNEKKKKTKRKKKRKIISQSVPDATVVENMEVSTKKQDGSENGKSDELNGSDKSGKKKKKKKRDRGEEKKNEESSKHFSPVPEAEGHGLQETITSVEPMKESKKRKCSESKESEELNVLAGNQVSAKKQDGSENGKSDELNGSDKSGTKKKMKKKKKKKSSKESSNHTSPVLKAVDCGHQDTTSVEALKESKKHKTSVSRDSDELVGSVRNAISVLEKRKTNEESSNHTAPVLAAKDNVEPAKAQESSASRRLNELAGLETNGASVSEGGNSTNVPDHTSCTTSKKRKLSSDNMQVTSVNMELPTNNSSCKEAESNMPQINELIPALNNGRAQPIWPPKWSGSVTVKQGNVCSIHGLVAHVSTLASPLVYEKARSLPTRLSAEMFPRSEIWPPSFLKNGQPADESIALYFFPSPDSNGEKGYYSLVDEMKKKDLAMRCLLDDVELLLFTSYQLPPPLRMFRSKEYLWGIFRRGKTSRL
ncbi:RING/FYVE/PHD zinc finger superfamily protein [Raphanus sativus]|uniref:Uncharacterized protein LOC108809590 n=1 Tax=Raphanus sativus TaxID=3726 RepID=A0A6J0JNK5_RAPSA|nr:uncharacterized protein LOC108809590 [Raphanus sativus]KAJ4917567.1 RING/FYVE/PHD zinc finger superfamily protein [Raphanus sativus]